MGGGSPITSASGVSTSDDDIRWCLPSSTIDGSTSLELPVARIAASLTGMPPLAAITRALRASPTSKKGAAGSRRFTHTNAISSA